MRFVELAPVNDKAAEMQVLYGRFDLDLFGQPTQNWIGRNLKKFRPPEMMQLTYFPDCYINRIWVNRRMLGAISQVYNEIISRWTKEARKAYGLDQFRQCFAFGADDQPNLFWYGAAWRLSPQVGGEVLSEAIKIFQKHGFTACGHEDKKRLRDFEFW